MLANDDPVALNLLYHQAVEDVGKGRLQAGELMTQLRSLKSQQEQYLDVVRSLPDYNTVQFPHCACDARKVGHVVMTIGIESLRLRACSEDGALEVGAE